MTHGTLCPECHEGRLRFIGDYEEGDYRWGCELCDFETTQYKTAHPKLWRQRLEPKGTLWDRNFYPTRWKQLRETILERDKNQCRFDGCPSIFNLDVHHINGNEFDMGEANLITLCDQHHAETQARLRKGWK